MEEELFEGIRAELCASEAHVQTGKMMRSEAITYKGKVFAFFSTKRKMVFKLGKSFRPQDIHPELLPFSPFKNKKPLNGWYELPFEANHLWESLSQKALSQLKTEI